MVAKKQSLSEQPEDFPLNETK